MRDNDMPSVIQEPSRSIPVIRDADVVVVGGGAAGIGAAVGAARLGARTLLIERYGFLGGTATAGLMACMNGFRNEMPPPRRQVIRGLAHELAVRIAHRGGCEDPGDAAPYCLVFDVEAYKHESQELCLEAGAELLLHSYFSDAAMSDGAIQAAVVESKSGRVGIAGKVFVDTSGDADLCVRAGAPYVTAGQEGEHEAMPMGLMIRLGAVDIAGMLDYVEAHPEGFKSQYWMSPLEECRKRWEQGRQFGVSGFRECFREKSAVDRRLGLMVFRNQVVTWGGKGGTAGLDPVGLTNAEVDSRRATMELVELMRRSLPGFENCELLDTGAQIGVRETRRVLGEYQLTEDDVMQGRKFPDAVAVCVNSILSMQDGTGRVYIDHEGYDIPYGTLIPRDTDNLLVAGRCQSATRRAFGSIRGIAICMVLGQAAGIAAALAADGDGNPRNIDVPKLQRILIDEGNILDIGGQIG